MDSSKVIFKPDELISQAEFARKKKYSPQWRSQLIADDRLDVVKIGDIDYVYSNTKIRAKKKKKSTQENTSHNCLK